MLLIALAALVCAALFAGAAGYITLVDHPTRMWLGDGPLLAQLEPSHDRALPIQSGLAVAGSVAGLGAWHLRSNKAWVLGSLKLLANWPFKLLAIVPTNRRLKAIRSEQAGPDSGLLLLSLGRLHDVRSVLGAASTAICAWVLLTSA